MSYRDRQVVVTGGTGALGSAVVSALLDAGAICYVPFRAVEDGERFVHRAHARVTMVPGFEAADEAAVERLYRGVPDLWASINIAGGFAWKPVGETSKSVLMGQIETNLVSAYLCSRAAVAAMRGGGRIVNVSARFGLEWRLASNLTAYAAAKAAVAAFTVALSEEVAKQGILVNAVAPSIMDTPANRKDMPKADFAAWPKVEEVAATILFLASPENTVTRGAVVPVHGKS
jgi:NAD(P)-dependent dehydrogenase (short-subunit alcohol dehydrogenase family)